jgi:LmbE family N-acetylglucosaminyl deacetylase
VDLFLSPHHDDETLFGSYTLIAHRPYVFFCTAPFKQESLGVTFAQRVEEAGCALKELGIHSWSQSLGRDVDSYELLLGILDDDFKNLDTVLRPERVWAPDVEQGGHEQHNLVGSVALDVFGDRVHSYLTYVRGQMRTRGTEVPFEPQWVSRKLRALAYYESQIALVGNTQPWFMDDTLREYVP